MSELKPWQIGSKICDSEYLEIYIQFEGGCSYATYTAKAKPKTCWVMHKDLLIELNRVINNFYRLEEENVKLKEMCKKVGNLCLPCKHYDNCENCIVNDLKKELGI